MDHFQYRDGVLHAEDVALPDIAEAVGTPFYCYSTATLTRHYQVFSDAFADHGLDATVCFAMKANSNKAVIRTLADLGAGADVVSGGELALAMAAGMPAERIVFSGVGKTAAEIEAALDAGIMELNVESEAELELIDVIARAKGLRAPISIRVNPDVAADTHHKIATGRKEDKFGIEWTQAHEVYKKAAALDGIEVVGIACHIGSQITDLEPFRHAFTRLRDLVAMLRADGIDIRRLDLGGGLGVPYETNNTPPPPPENYARVVQETLGDLGCSFLLEPGRLIAGNAGILVTEVIRVKEGDTRTFLIVDAAMNDLIRPAMYEAYHDIVPVEEPEVGVERVSVDVVGPVCESGDTFAVQRALPPIEAGALLVLKTAGAYGAVMSSTYNSRPLIPEVMVNGDAFAVVRRRPTFEEMTALEALPDWLG